MTDTRQELCAWLRDPMPRGYPSDDVIALARSDDVHLLLAQRCGPPALLPELHAAAAVEEVRARELQRVLSALAAEGIDAVLLKGAAMARTHYSRPELRPRSDTDFIIPERSREDAARVLATLEYQRASEV